MQLTTLNFMARNHCFELRSRASQNQTMALLKLVSPFHKSVIIPQSSREPRLHLQFKPKTLQHKTHLLTPVIFAKSPRKPGKGEDPYPFYPSNVLLRQGFPSIANDEPTLSKCYSNVKILAGTDEPEEKLIGRFRREVMKAGVLQECKRRRYFESTQEKKKRKARDAAKRNRKRRPKAKASVRVKKEAVKKKCDSDDDNWEMFDVELPYC